MRQLVIILASMMLAFAPTSAELKKLDSRYFEVEYEEEAEAYALASLKILEFVRAQAIEQGFIFPRKLKFSLIRSDRNVLYFDYKKLKGITWEYNSMKNLLPPDESGKKNVYGLCHEMGHLCMYYLTHNKNNWMSKSYRESWADFFGNYMIDSVYQHLGSDIWPEPHNYLMTAGTGFMLNRFQHRKENPDEFDYSCKYWYELNERLGFDKFSGFFEEIARQKVRNPDAREKYFMVLSDFTGDEELSVWFNKYADHLILSNE